VVIKDASAAADYVNSLPGHYQAQVARPWRDVAGQTQLGTLPEKIFFSRGSHGRNLPVT
jgi:hypothetical protein